MSIEQAGIIPEFTKQSEYFTPPRPLLIYDQSLQKAPYQVKINELKYGAFLNEIGMSPQEIAGLAVYVKRKPKWPFDHIGQYNSAFNSITIYTDWVQEYREGYSEWIKLIVYKGKKPTKDLFRDFYTKKLPGYLKTCAESGQAERGENFAMKLVNNYLEREVNSTLIHEGKHALDHQDKRFHSFYLRQNYTELAGILSLWATDTWLIAHLPALFFRNYHPTVEFIYAFFISSILMGYLMKHMDNKAPRLSEQSAYETEERYKNDPKWRGILTLEANYDVV